jgi:hypothetical protein
MLFCQVTQMKSSREVCLGLASCEAPLFHANDEDLSLGARLKHLGLMETPKRSTLAFANEHRP